MQKIQWTAEYELGIPVIDTQHRRIVDYINQLCDANTNNDQAVIADVIHNLVDYTNSHFAFEEAMMEEIGYDALTIHQATHRAFTQRINSINEKADTSHQVADDLIKLLTGWLLDHIQHDDSSYAPLVREQIMTSDVELQKGWIRKTLGRFFG